MIGNDLVDLEQAAKDSNWERKGYLDKIYTLKEQETIRSANHPNQLVWILWSMKEAVYKIHSRKTGIRSYAPTSLVCTNLIFNAGQVSGQLVTDSTHYYTCSSIEKSYIHTIAATSLTELSTITIEIYAYPSNLFDYKNLNPKCISHHGRFLALVY